MKLFKKKKILRPVTEKERQAQNMNLVGPNWTVCETIRKIYRLAAEINDDKAKEIMKRAKTALVMAKKMNKKLREYRSDYDKGWWEKK